MTQNDILNQVEFEDRVAFGGWSIDLHPPGGMYAAESGSKHLQADGNYYIPFRSLYSRNVKNLLFAGRNISASHVAFGSTRVMATCAVMGEAAGVGAALSIDYRITPRELQANYMKIVQQTMLKQGASLLGVANEDDNDLAQQATVEGSSYCQQIEIREGRERYSLIQNAGFLFPVDSQLENISILLDASVPTIVEIEIWETGKPQNYIPHSIMTRAIAEVAKGEKQWVKFEINNVVIKELQNVFVIVKANKDVALYLSAEPMTGVLSFKDAGAVKIQNLYEQIDSPVLRWSMKGLERKPFCFFCSRQNNSVFNRQGR